MLGHDEYYEQHMSGALDNKVRFYFLGATSYLLGFFSFSLTPLIALLVLVTIQDKSNKMMIALCNIVLGVQTVGLSRMSRFCIINGCISTVLMMQSLSLVCYVIAITYIARVWKESSERKNKMSNVAIIMPMISIAIGLTFAFVSKYAYGHEIKVIEEES